MSRSKEGRYMLLQQYLSNLNLEEVELSFEEIEKIINVSLPDSAYNRRQWWANSKKRSTQSNAWYNAGYKVKSVDLGEFVVFKKSDIEQIVYSSKVVNKKVEQVILQNESNYVEKISNKLLEASAFLNNANFEGFSNTEVMSQFELLKRFRRTIGNIDNDMSFLGCLLIKEFLQNRHDLPDLNMALKAQGSPGLDLDEITEDGKRIIGELKTTYPYMENDLGSQQRNSFFKDFEKLQRSDAQFKYFFVTELKTFEIVCNKYYQHLQGVQIVLLPEAIEDSEYIKYVKEI